MMARRGLAVGLLVALGLVSACGGGSGGGGGGPSTPVALFIADSFRDDYSHVWLTVHRIELRDSGSASFVVAFDDANGVPIDAARFHDSAGPRFGFLTRAQVPPGTYDSVRVTFGGQVELVLVGSATGTSHGFAPEVPVDGLGRPQVSYALAPPLVAPSTSELREVIDFDLANFALDGGGLLAPSLTRGSHTGLDDPARHEQDDVEGAISNLRPSTFLLNAEHGMPFEVHFGISTVIVHAGTGLPGTLAEGQHVEVHGMFHSAEGQFEAASIRIEDGGQGSPEPSARGNVTNVNLPAQAFTLSNVSEVRGFTPAGSSLIVTWNSSTVFRRGHDIVTSSWLLLYPMAEVHGAPGSSGAGIQTFAAMEVALEDDHGPNDGEAEARGATTQIDTNANTLVLSTIVEFEGFVPNGPAIQISWNDVTTIFLLSGVAVTEAALLTHPVAEVKGTFNPGTNTLSAIRIKLSDDASPGGGEIEASGTTSAVDLVQDGFVLGSLTQVQGFQLQGSAVNVRWTSQTIFRRGSHVVDETALQQYPFAEVRGITFDAVTNTITASEIHVDDNP